MPDQPITTNLTALRLAIAALALVAVVVGERAERRGGKRARTARLAALGILAGLAFATNHHLFVGSGLHVHEFFHYYLGAKYSPELGYQRLYTCAIEAARPPGERIPDTDMEITDLRVRKEWRSARQVMAESPPCEESFGPARWHAFRRDVGWFKQQLGRRWPLALRDSGYNPSPVWTLLGRPIASLVPAESATLAWVARIDAALLLMAFVAVGAAFGFQAACLVAIAWGANPLTGPEWIGNAFLRQAWFASALIGLSLLRAGRPAGAGALLSLSALLRLFPSLLVLGYLLRECCGWMRSRHLASDFRRFLISAGAATLLLLLAGAWASGRGPGVYAEFAHNIRVHTYYTPRNAVGLKSLLQFSRDIPRRAVASSEQSVPYRAIQEHKDQVLAARRPLYYGIIALFVVLFVRAAASALPWEAAALGATLIPVLTLPACYYLGFCATGALLATRRPSIAVALLLLVMVFSAASLAFGERAVGFAVSSAALLAFLLYVLIAAQPRPSGPPAAP